jgi:general secretion pathway protein I
VNNRDTTIKLRNSYVPRLDRGIHKSNIDAGSMDPAVKSRDVGHGLNLMGVNNRGFTLIEVLLALAVISISLTALIRATGQDVNYTHLIKERSISHWVAMNGAKMIQLGLIESKNEVESTQVTNMLSQKWYWRHKLKATPVATVKQIVITVSKNQSGPFTHPLTAFKFVPPVKT